MCVSKEIAWRIVDEIRGVVDSLPREVKSIIYSIVVFGSLVRGDFVDDVSDIDILIVFKNGAPQESIRSVLDAVRGVEARFNVCKNFSVLDVVWVYEEEIPLVNRFTKTFFKFFTIYAFDFIKNSEVIYGEDFRDRLFVKNPKFWVPSRIIRLKKLFKKWVEDGNARMLMILAGEVIRLAQIAFGKPTINKWDVIKLFREYVPNYPMKSFAETIWREYLTPKNRKVVDEKYIKNIVRFIKDTLEMIENKLDFDEIKKFS